MSYPENAPAYILARNWGLAEGATKDYIMRSAVIVTRDIWKAVA